MKDILQELEQRTSAFNALDREGVANAVWADYVKFRFGHTGDTRALEFLYPYLNHANKGWRLTAIEVAAQVFEGQGPGVLPRLDYFTRNSNLAIADRASWVAAAALTGSSPNIILEALEPYFKSKNRFVKKVTLIAMGKAARGTGSKKVLEIIKDFTKNGIIRNDEASRAIANLFSGRPTEEAYSLIQELDTGFPKSITEFAGRMIEGAPIEWYERSVKDIFKPAINTEGNQWNHKYAIRLGALYICLAGRGRGMKTLEEVIHLHTRDTALNYLLKNAYNCFTGADVDSNRCSLIKLLREGNSQEQRIACACVGELLRESDDNEAMDTLTTMCDSGDHAVRASAIHGLGMVGMSGSHEETSELCIRLSEQEITMTSAITALGLLHLGTGNSDVFYQLRSIADRIQVKPVTGRKHNKSLAACYHAVGLLYLGTGSDEPIEMLLDVLTRPENRQHTDVYKAMATRALMMVEFTRTRLGWDYILNRYPLPSAFERNHWLNRIP